MLDMVPATGSGSSINPSGGGGSNNNLDFTPKAALGNTQSDPELSDFNYKNGPGPREDYIIVKTDDPNKARG